MEMCRLCAKETSSNNLIISLNDVLKDEITFLDFVEFYCHLNLAKSPELPQKVCSSCKNQISSFIEFSHNVEVKQSEFEFDRKSPIPKYTDDEEAHDEPEAKKPKIMQTNNNDNDTEFESEVRGDPEISAEEEGDKEEANQNKNANAVLKHRRKSVKSTPAEPDSEKTTVAYYLQEVEKIFGQEKQERIDLYEKITISKSKLLPFGEVPRSWLKQFKDFKTWEDLPFSCTMHCKEKFNNLNELLLHNQNLPVKNRFVHCKECDRKFGGNKYYVCSFVNHLSKSHYEYIKFSCVFCCKVFCNMPFLKKHYQDHHSDSGLMPLLTCLECGLYAQSVNHLKSHKKYHDKCANEVISDVE